MHDTVNPINRNGFLACLDSPHRSPAPPLGDSGCSDVLIKESDAQHTSITNRQPAHGPPITAANGGQFWPIATADLAIPGRHQAQRIPALICRDEDITHSLIGFGPLCQRGMSVHLYATGLTINHADGTLAAQTSKRPDDMLWSLPFSAFHQLANQPASQVRLPTAANVITHSFNAETVLFWHAALGSPPASTLIRALAAGFLRTIPGLTLDLVRRNPPNTLATGKGHLSQTRKGLRSTRRQSSSAGHSALSSTSADPPVNDDDDWLHDDEPATNTLLVRVLHGSEYSSTNHSDMPARLPTRSHQGNNYQMVSVYNNYIHVVPLPTKTAQQQVIALNKTIQHLRRLGHYPKVQRLDNDYSELMAEFLRSNDLVPDLVPPTAKRRNRAERANATWKNHTVATWAGCDPQCPLEAWEYFLPQQTITINCLRPYGPNPNISAYEGIHGHPFDFDRYPIAPCGTKVVIFETPAQRASWAPHGVTGYYVGPATNHYRSFNVITAEGLHPRVSNSLAWYPTSFRMPGSDPRELLLAAVTDLSNAVAQLAPPSAPGTDTNPFQRTQGNLTAALHDLIHLFTGPSPGTSTPAGAGPSRAAGPLPTPDTAPSPRVPGTDAVAATPRAPDRPPAPDPPPSPRVPAATDAVAATPRAPDRPPAPDPAPSPRVPAATDAVAATPRAPERPLAPDTAPSPRVFAAPDASLPRVSPARPEPPPNRTYTEQQRATGLPYSPATTTVPAPPRPQRAARPPARFAGAAATPSSPGTTAEAPLHSPHTEYHSAPDPHNYKAALRTADSAIWESAASEEFDRLIVGTKTMHFIPACDVPTDRLISYYNPQCKSKLQDGKLVYRVRGVVGGNRSDYEGAVTARTASMTDVKIFLNAAISEGATFITADIKDFYLQSVLERPEYMRIMRSQVPPATQLQYNIEWEGPPDKQWKVVEITKGIYGLPQAGLLAQKALIAHLASFDYVQCDRTPCLFRHLTLPIAFVLTVDDFGIKFKGKEHAEHLIQCLQEKYTLKVNWQGDSYIGFNVDYDLANRRVTLSMPGYVARALTRFKITKNPESTDAPAAFVPVIHGKKEQQAVVDNTPPLDPARAKLIQEIVGVFLYYARGVDSSMITTCNNLAQAQAAPTEATWAAAQHFLQYAATWPNAQLVFHASDMVLKVQSDGSHLSISNARSRAGGLHYLGNHDDGGATVVNGSINNVCQIIPVVTASAGETEYAALFINAVDAEVERNTLEDLGYPQGATPIKSDNAFAVDLANGWLTQKRSKAIDNRFHWIRDRSAQGHFTVTWEQGSNNLADYFTKIHPVEYMRARRKFFITDPPCGPRANAAGRRNARRAPKPTNI